jgi:hypothetical protein
MRIYVAGPYDPKQAKSTHDAPRIAHQNVQKAAEIGLALWKMGHNPYVPHFGHYLNIISDEDLTGFMGRDFEWLDACDALYFIAPSNGANRELERAKQRGMPIFYSLEQVPAPELAYDD